MKLQPMKNLIGNTINQYQILVKIRETGTRILYRAYDTKSSKYVGLDVVKIRIIDQHELLALLEKQFRKNAEIKHSNIAAVVDFGICNDIIFFVYDFSPAHILHPLFNRIYSWEELSRELVPVTQALAHAHERGIYHGFLNPFSIIVDVKKNPILFDFCFENIIGNYVLSHSPGSWINNWGFEYCSPELLKGQVIDCRSDVYAFGMILHEWLTGEIALLEDTALVTLAKRNLSSSQALDLNSKISPTIQKLLQKCLAPNPVNRFQTMQELSVLLAHSALDLTISEKMIQNPLTITKPKPSQRRWSIVLIPILLVSMGIALTLWNNINPIFQRESWEQPTKTITITLKPSTPSGVSAQPSPTMDPIVIETPIPNRTSYPIFQGTTLSPLSSSILIGNADELINLSFWGIGDVNRLVTSPDSFHFAVSSSVGVFIYDVQTLELEKQLDTRSWVSAIEYSPDGRRIAIGDQDGLISLWDTNSWQELAVYSGHKMGVLDMAFSPDGTKLASVSMDNTLIQWETRSDENYDQVSIPVPGVTCLVYTQDGTAIGTGGDDFKINLWDAKELNLLRTITISSKIIDMTIINNSSFLAVGGSDRRVTIVDINGSSIVRQFEGLQYPLSGVASSSDGGIVAGGDINGGIAVWDINGELLWQIPGEIGNFRSEASQGNIHSLAFSTDGKFLLSGLRTGLFRVINVATSEESLRDQSFDLHASKLTISGDSFYAISQNSNGTLKVWDINNGVLLYELQGELKAGEPFSTDNKYFAVAADNSTVKVYELSSGKEYYTFNDHQSIDVIQFVNGDAQLAAGNEQIMHLWSLSSGQEIKTSKSFGGNGCTTVSDLKENAIFYITKYNYIFEDSSNTRGLCGFQIPDWMKVFFINEARGQIASGGNSKLTVTSTRNEDPANLEMVGVNRKNIIGVAINPDGSLLAAAFDDNTIHLWDISTQTELMSLYGHDGLITDIQFTPNGKLILSTSMDGTIRLWGVPN